MINIEGYYKQSTQEINISIKQMKANQKQQWDEKSLKFTQRQAHNKNLIGLCVHSQNTFLTSSEDRTVRLWDIRTQSSVKMIRNPCLSEQLSNPASNMESAVYIGCDKNLYEFDLRKQHIFIEDVVASAGQPHYDSIGRITFNAKREELLCCDDEGDIRVYDTTNHLKCIGKLEQEHVNICNAVQVVSSERKELKGKRMCVSGGFDGSLIIWDIDEQKPIKKVPIFSILEKQGLKDSNQFIHSISAIDTCILLGLESGCVVNVAVFEPHKPKFILHASLTRITDSKVVTINNKKILISCSIDQTFAMFDYEQRIGGVPKFIQRYSTHAEPTQIEYFSNCFLLVGSSNKLGIYQIKQ